MFENIRSNLVNNTQNNDSNNKLVIEFGSFKTQIPKFVTIFILFIISVYTIYFIFDGEFRDQIICIFSNEESCNEKSSPVIPQILTSHVCRVNNPTNRRINVRETPNGKDIGDQANRSEVRITGIELDDRKRTWALIEDGYIFMELLDCPNETFYFGRPIIDEN